MTFLTAGHQLNLTNGALNLWAIKMSYEGYEIGLCELGHFRSSDCYIANRDERCSCGALFAWWFAVDQTNDSGVRPLLIIWKDAEYDRCLTCDHSKLIHEEQYCIPSNHGHIMPGTKPKPSFVEIRLLCPERCTDGCWRCKND